MTSAHNGPRYADRAARFTFHAGGRLATVLPVQVATGPRAQVGGGPRGLVRGFSPGSRRRLMRRIASVNRFASERAPAFLTLTYPRAYPTDPAKYRGHARAFLKRLRRKYGARPVVWRLEFQARGAPHFHMLVWDLEVSESVDTWIRDAWYSVVDSGDLRHAQHGTDLQDLKCWKRVAVYLSKYIAKVADADGEVHEPVGRWWGVECGALLVVEPVGMVLGYRMGLKLRRAMQKGARMRRPGGQGDRGCTVFLGDDVAVRLALHHGATFERPPPSEPPPTYPAKRAVRDAGFSWRMRRHAEVLEAMSVLRACREHAAQSAGPQQLLLFRY